MTYDGYWEMSGDSTIKTEEKKACDCCHSMFPHEQMCMNQKLCIFCATKCKRCPKCNKMSLYKHEHSISERENWKCITCPRHSILCTTCGKIINENGFFMCGFPFCKEQCADSAFPVK